MKSWVLTEINIQLCFQSRDYLQ